jgi:hypothetical protein
MTETQTKFFEYLRFEHLKIRNWGPARRVGSPQDQFCICFVLRVSYFEFQCKALLFPLTLCSMLHALCFPWIWRHRNFQ